MADFMYQLYSSRNFGPIDSTLAMLGQLGYAGVEGYGDLHPDLKLARKVREKLEYNGLAMSAGHVDFARVRSEPKQVISIAKELGMEAIFVPYLAENERPRDAAGWAALGTELAERSKPFQDAGLIFGWHNHDFEFAGPDGAGKPLDLMLEASEDLALELDIGWVKRSGEDPVDWIRKYSDRIHALHIKDIAAEHHSMNEDGWADVGHGIMDWPEIAAAIDLIGQPRLVLEHDNPSDDHRFAACSISAARGFFSDDGKTGE